MLKFFFVFIEAHVYNLYLKFELINLKKKILSLLLFIIFYKIITLFIIKINYVDL